MGLHHQHSSHRPLFDVEITRGKIDMAGSPYGGVPPVTVTIEQGASQTDPTFDTSIVFDVVFSESVTGFATGDVTLSGTAPGTLVGSVSGSGATYTVTVTGMTGGGTVTADIAASVCVAVSSGLPNLASTSVDNTVTYATPADIAGIHAWYDASDLSTIHLSGSDVTQWDDKSGGGHHLVRATSLGPSSGTRTKNGLNVLDFQNTTPGSGTGQRWLWLPPPDELLPNPQDNYTLFVVFVTDTAPSVNFSAVAYFGTSAEHGIRTEPDTKGTMVVTAGGGAVAQSAAHAVGTWRLLTGACDGPGGGPITLRQNGTLVDTSVLTGSPTTGGQFNVACRTGGGRPFKGAVAEVIYYFPILGGTDVSDIETYLINKWSIP